MLSRKYKTAFGQFVRPLNLALHRLRVNADQMTLAGVVFGGLAGLAFAQDRFPLGGLFLVLSGISDMLDGSLARAAGLASPFGSFIDSVADRFTDCVIFGGLAWHYRETPTLLVVLAGLTGSLLVSYTRARAEGLGVPCDIGLMERPERIICLIAGAFIPISMKPVLWLLAVLSLATAVQRILHARRELNRLDNGKV